MARNHPTSAMGTPTAWALPLVAALGASLTAVLALPGCTPASLLNATLPLDDAVLLNADQARASGGLQRTLMGIGFINRTPYRVLGTFGGYDPQDQETVVGYDARREQLFVDRGRSGAAGFSSKFDGRHEAPLAPTDGRVAMRVLVDRCSVEAFGGGGLASVTDLVFPDPGSDGLEAYAVGGEIGIRALQVYEMGSIRA